MVLYSKIGLDNIVVDIVVLEDDFINEADGIAYLKELTGHETWLRSEKDGVNGQGMKGCILDSVRKAWIYEQPFPSWTLDDNGEWQPPITEPTLTEEQRDNDLDYFWIEESQFWELTSIHD